MKLGCPIRQTLAEQFATAARLYAETAVSLATMGKSGADYILLRDKTIEAQEHSTAAFRAFTEHVASHHCSGAVTSGEEHMTA
ncbi:MAG TPA: hypothetical protein VKB88_05630 [Bryobacteraceae bacterium]|nr:hypothetical protein [Bryobacteraceae bacterium]